MKQILIGDEKYCDTPFFLRNDDLAILERNNIKIYSENCLHRP